MKLTVNARSRRMKALTAALAWCSVAGLLAFGVNAQSLTDKLEEEQSFYLNYGKESYAKLKIEKDVIGHYDGFGEHIVDGVHLYSLGNASMQLSNSQVEDSVDYSQSNEFQKYDFYEKFSNLVVTQDALGGVKTSFMIGDQITTKFTPLTFNKTNFKGVRWDWWSSGLKFSAALTRTRPGWTSTMKGDGTGEALVEYPITEQSFPSDYYGRGIKGDKDFSSKSPYGDYDFLWALHAENTIANKIDVGISLVNHHSNDIKKGANFLKGDLPDSLMPDFIHFEFYDQTPADTLDAGVFVERVDMYVNGTDEAHRVVATPAYRNTFRRAFVGDRDKVLLPREIPLARPQNGPVPVIVEFATDPKYWQFIDGTQLRSRKSINRVYYKYTLAGNYMAFVSTDRQIPLSIYGTYNPQRREVDYVHPARSVGEIYDAGLSVNAQPTGVAYREENYSTTYFGEYVAQSPKKVFVSDGDFTNLVEQRNTNGSWPGDRVAVNHRTYTYEFNLNVSSATYGLNFRGEIAKFKFSGEIAYNHSEDMLPGGGDEGRTDDHKFAGLLKVERPIGKQFGVNAEGYYISPEWRTNMSSLAASQYFNQTNYKSDSAGAARGLMDYQVYPRPLDRSWQNIDDNDDNDAFVDNEPRRYPSDLDADGERDKFYNDGTLKASSGEMKTVTLPSGMEVPYDDPDGVVASKNDKNLNGVSDYNEDFLLFSNEPPVFDLGIDLNNNGTPDYEDDDLLPDYFSEPGRSVGAVVTGDGIRTLGIQGGKLNLRWTPLENTNLDIGVVLESVVDRDFDLENTGGDDKVEGDQDGQSLVGYATFKREILQRSKGVQAEYGLEARYVRDAIRNDVIGSSIRRVGEEIDAQYGYQIDRLAYRNAVVAGLLGSFIYTNIKDFEYAAKVKVGGEMHMALDEPVYEQAYSPDYGGYRSEWGTYDDRIIVEAHAVNRVQYRMRLNKEFEGNLAWLNFLNRFELVPQYKVQYYSRQEVSGPEETAEDPRDIRKNIQLDYNSDGEIDMARGGQDDYGANLDSVAAIRDRWNEFQMNNWSVLMSVPIVRLDFKMAENTKLQLGYQWARFYDIESPESNMAKHSLLAQLVSKAQYKGYSVTFFLGARWWYANFDVNQDDAVTYSGSKFDVKGYEFFAKIFSGI